MLMKFLASFVSRISYFVEQNRGITIGMPIWLLKPVSFVVDETNIAIIFAQLRRWAWEKPVNL